jgi:hypothetical protein
MPEPAALETLPFGEATARFERRNEQASTRGELDPPTAPSGNATAAGSLRS